MYLLIRVYSMYTASNTLKDKGYVSANHLTENQNCFQIAPDNTLSFPCVLHAWRPSIVSPVYYMHRV